jgi:hypothetical protein
MATVNNIPTPRVRVELVAGVVRVSIGGVVVYSVELAELLRNGAAELARVRRRLKKRKKAKAKP